MHSITLFSDAFVCTNYSSISNNWMEKLIFKWAWTWKHGRIHIILLMNILNGWIIRVPRQFCRCNKSRHSSHHGWKYPEMLMVKEVSGIHIGNLIVKYVYLMFNALANLISTSWMHLYQILISSNKEFQNVSIFLL